MQQAVSLRERRRLDTLKAVHDASITLLHEGNLTSVTVDAIAERAGVSRRTFFNYYATKEDAILGTVPPTVPNAALAEFLDEDSDTDRFTRTIRLISAIMQTTREVGRVDSTEILELLRRFPDLRARLQQHTAAAERLVEDVLTEQLSRSTPDAERVADSARALVLLTSAVLRFAYSRDPMALTDPNRDSVKSAIAVFKAALAEVGTEG